jgi:hypothetical protein
MSASQREVINYCYETCYAEVRNLKVDDAWLTVLRDCFHEQTSHDKRASRKRDLVGVQILVVLDMILYTKELLNMFCCLSNPHVFTVPIDCRHNFLTMSSKF